MSPEVSDVFSRLDPSKEKSYSKTKKSEDADEHSHPRLVKLQKGLRPEYIKLTPYQALSWKIMGKAATKAKADVKLEDALVQAHMPLRPEEYKAYMMFTALLAAIVGLVVGGVLLATMEVFEVALVSAIMLPLVFGVLTYALLNMMPGSTASSRGRDISKRIGPSMSFISAMASADVNVDVIFKELARQDIYGSVKEEAEWITRDTELLGLDIITAVSRAAQRTPSDRFQDFLQGVVTTSTSGGQLKPYFLQKADQYEKEAKLQNRAMLENLGLMAETYVTVVVAFPLFLVVIMAIMAIIGGLNPEFAITLLYLVVAVMVPVSQFGFIFFVWNTTEEARA